MKVQEINHFSVSEPVDEISNSAAQNQREGKGEGLFMLFHSKKEEDNGSDGDQGDQHKENGPESSLFPAENSKSAPRVPEMREVKKPLDHIHPPIKGYFLYDQVLGPLVQQENPDTENGENPVFSFHAHPNDESIGDQNFLPD